jgi:hypothetical protein
VKEDMSHVMRSRRKRDHGSEIGYDAQKCPVIASEKDFGWLFDMRKDT